MAAGGQFLTEEMRQRAIGTESRSLTHDVEKGAIKRFAEAVGDSNPLWTDEVAARNARYGGLVAPPTFLRSVRFERPQPPFDTPFRRILDGGSEWEYFEPVRVGDQITAIARITDVSERSGRLGTMLLTVIGISYVNQFDHVVATQSNTMIWY